MLVVTKTPLTGLVIGLAKLLALRFPNDTLAGSTLIEAKAPMDLSANEAGPTPVFDEATSVVVLSTTST